MDRAGTVHVLSGRQKKLTLGHPWVYGNEIARVEGAPEDGDCVSVVDDRGRFLGAGVYNSQSLITVRLLTSRQEPVDGTMIVGRVRQAVAFRRYVLSRPGTDCARLIFGEADRLPGVIADQFGPVIVLQVLSLGMERFTEVIAKTLMETCHPECLFLMNDDPIRLKEGLTCFTKVLYGTLPERVTAHENGLLFRYDLAGGQKTGGFLDQKDNHLYLRQFCGGKRVMDCFCYAGGFALNAAAAGAETVTAVDISGEAIALTKENAAANGLAIETVQANCFDFLRERQKAGARYDVIVLDPPAFTKAKANRANAARGYKEIALQAMRMLPAGGILATHSCSYHMPEDLFVQTIESAGHDLHRRLRIIALRRQDIDHPVLAGYPESHYLKSLWLEMME